MCVAPGCRTGTFTNAKQVQRVLTHHEVPQYLGSNNFHNCGTYILLANLENLNSIFAD